MTGKRVLIVDDALELGRMLRFALESLEAGLDVRVVPSAEEAILEASRQPVSLIVVDFRLPGMTGLEMIDKIRTRTIETRFILISGMSDDRFLESVKSLKADRFMPKPLQISEFLEVACELLGITVKKEGPLPVAVKAPSAQEEVVSAPVLAGVLTRLRQELGARVTLLADDRGRVVAQAGDMGEEDFESTWGAALAAALNATSRLSRLLQTGSTASAQLIRGENASLVLAPVGDYALLILLKSERSGLRSALAVEETLNAQKELSAILEKIGAPYQVITPPPVEPAAAPPVEVVETLPEVDESVLHEMDSLLKSGSGRLDSQEADHFWEQATNFEPYPADNPDVITYDQARKLGLTPEDEDRKES